MNSSNRGWWESPYLWLAIAAATMVPFAFTSVAPLTDLPNHIARFHVFLTIDNSPFLQNFYSLQWMLVGNLGVDLPVRVIGPYLGAELATKVVVATIPPLTIAGIYALSRSLNGQVSPAALAATPLAYNWPFNIGLINFSLSAAVAMLVLALWIRLRTRNFFFRFVLFAVLGFVTWVAHTAGWGLLGLGVFGYELARRAKTDGWRIATLIRAAFETLPFALMILVTALWSAGKQSHLGLDFANNFIRDKIITLATLFRENILAWDWASTAIYSALLVAFFLALGRRLLLAPVLIFALYMCVVLFGPTYVFQSGFIDRRVLPYAFIVLLLCIDLSSLNAMSHIRRKAVSVLAMLSVLFIVARLAMTAMAWANWSVAFENRMAILDHIPAQSRLFNVMVEGCDRIWPRIGRADHVQTMALVRRESAVNGLFQGEGFNQVEVLFRKDEGFDPNMLAFVRKEECALRLWGPQVGPVIAQFPREIFDYLWLVSDQPLPPFDETGLTLVASTGNDRIYRIEHGN